MFLQLIRVIIIDEAFALGGENAGAFGRTNQLAGHSAELTP